MRHLVYRAAVQPRVSLWQHSTAWGFAPRFAASASGATSNLLPAVAELVSHCQEPTPLIEVVKALSAPSLAAIFKHGKGLHGYVQDFGAGVVEIRRGSDGALRVARSAEQPRSTTPPSTETAKATSSPAPPTNQSVDVGGVESAVQPAAAALGPPCTEEDALITLVKTLFDTTTAAGGGHQFIHINTVYQALYPSPEAKATVSVPQLMAFLAGPKAAKHFWVVDLFVRLRLPGEVEAPQLPNTSAAFRVTTAHSGNNYGGWGAASNVPTAADVYEMLKYVPVHWGNMGSLNIPPEVKKRHARTSSILQWFRRQPKYFELRCVAGTVEIRRSVLLHPEEHGMTPASAQAWLEARIFSGEHNVVTSSTSPTSTAADHSTLSAAQSAILKFLLRVCPAYLTPMALLIQRSTKKSWTVQDLHTIATEHPDKFEVVPTPCGLHLYRRRTGSMAREAEASHGVMEDLQNGDNHRMRALLALMSKSCSLWDRPEFLYVRLSDEDKNLAGGYEGMWSLMRAAPRIFRTGSRYYCRGDWSNPIIVQQQEREPTDDELLSTAAAGMCACEENPYLTPKELATVFHYVIPDGHPSVSVSFFVESSSPAMRSVLPPRLMDLIQLFPQLFSWRETAPGVFSIRKVQRGAAPHDARVASLGTGDDAMTPAEAIDALMSLIPAQGVDVDTLQTWASLEVNEVLTKEYGSWLRAVASHPKRFSVEAQSSGKQLVRLRATPAPAAS